MSPGRLRAWFLACRPKTLPVSLSPVVVGSAIAWHDTHALLWLPLLAAALGAAFIQIGTNLFNDVGDFLRGTDTPDRLGPKRATAEGWLTPGAVKAGAWLCFALAFLCGIYLVWHGGWPIVAIGLASLAAGWAYTGGPKPIAYGPLGEFFVFIFFGLVAVGGSYYLQTLNLTPTALLAAALVGIHAAAVITGISHAGHGKAPVTRTARAPRHAESRRGKSRGRWSRCRRYRPLPSPRRGRRPWRAGR